MQENESNLLGKGENLHFIYNGLNLDLSAKKSNCILRFYKFTPIGVELAHLIGDDPDATYFTYLKQQLSHHFTLAKE